MDGLYYNNGAMVRRVKETHMYRITGWPPEGGRETIYLQEWEEVQMLVAWLEEDMYRAIRVVNMETLSEPISWSAS